MTAQNDNNAARESGFVMVCGANPEPNAPLLDVCPKCGTKTEGGYGLAYGGMGVYVFCPAEGCDYHAKQQEADE